MVIALLFLHFAKKIKTIIMLNFNFVKSKIKSKINQVYPVFYYTKSYSQEGEDILLSRIFKKQKKGFYVDIGAHHPTRFSNTYYFYKLGWRGINIDAMPDSMKLFNRIRPDDINLEIAISSQPTQLTYYIFDEPALNTFDPDIALYHESKNGRSIVSKKVIKTQKLSEILDLHLPENQKIDFMSVDVEGLDYEVLISNDWSKYKPRLILVEDRNQYCLQTIEDSRLAYFLQKQGYSLYSKLVFTLVFMYQS